MATFHMTDAATGTLLSTEQAEAALCDILTNPAKAKQHWEKLGSIQRRLLILCIAVNPELRDEIWDAVGDDGRPVLTERDKFHIIVAAQDNDEDAAMLVQLIVHDVVSEKYQEA